MRTIQLSLAALAGCLACATNASAQSTNQNPMGLDLGAMHSMMASPVPVQTTTYYPPEPAARHRHARPSRSRY